MAPIQPESQPGTVSENRTSDLDSIKKSLEIEKLKAELSEMSKPSYRKAAYLGPAVTLLVGFVAAFFAFFTNLLNSNITHLISEKKRLENEVGQLSMNVAYSDLIASIFESTTDSAVLLARRIRNTLDPESSSKARPQNLGEVYQSLQDNLNFVSLARSLLSLFQAIPGSDPMNHAWNFTYSMLDVRPRSRSSETQRIIHLLSHLRLLPSERSGELLQQIKGPSAYSYFWVTGELSTPLRDSPLFERGLPRSRASFIRAYRHSLAAFLQTSPEDRYRLVALQDDALWNRLESAGVPNFHQLLPGMSNLQTQIIGSDYIFIVWSSEALSRISDSAFAASRAIAQRRWVVFTGPAKAVSVTPSVAKEPASL
jgi:hypothetical protein